MSGRVVPFFLFLYFCFLTFRGSEGGDVCRVEEEDGEERRGPNQLTIPSSYLFPPPCFSAVDYTYRPTHQINHTDFHRLHRLHRQHLFFFFIGQTSFLCSLRKPPTLTDGCCATLWLVLFCSVLFCFFCEHIHTSWFAIDWCSMVCFCFCFCFFFSRGTARGPPRCWSVCCAG